MGIQNQITFTIIITTFLIAYNGVSAINDSLSEGVQNSTIDSADQPSADNVYNDIQTISNWYRYLDTSGHREAENYIFSKFESFGLNVSRQEYTANRMDGSVRAVNVLGLLEGDIEPWKWLVIAGHYDANQRSTHGAYDNAAGAASVIELARYITEYYETAGGPEISILFAAWDAEEGGGAGSKYFVDNREEGIDIVANINLDMFSLNYPIKNQIPGSAEEYYRLNLYTCPTSDFSGYSGIDFSDGTKQNFTTFQEALKNITYEKNGLPPEWVPVVDDTETVSDHKFFIQNSIPAVWFRGMNEYPKNEGDLNERNFKHTPTDTLDTMECYAGGKGELLKGIEMGLSIAEQLAFEVINYSCIEHSSEIAEEEGDSAMGMAGIGATGWLVAGTAVVILFGGFYIYRRKNRE